MNEPPPPPSTSAPHQPTYAPYPAPSPTIYAATAAAALTSSTHSPTQNASANRKRRATGEPGSRGVANLTPDQLAKKRANDREAQRAIRERTKNTIEGLEGRIRELEAQQPYQELMKVVRERDEARRECEELRRRLGAVAGIVGGSSGGLGDLRSPLPPVHEAVGAPAYGQQQQQLQHQQGPQQPPQQQQQQQQHHQSQHLHPDLRSPHSNHSPTSAPASAAPVSPYANEEAAIRTWSQSASHASNNPQYPTPGENDYDTLQQRPTPSSHSPYEPANGERHNLNFLLESSTQQQQQHQPSHSPHNAQPYPSPQTDLHPPIHARFPLNGPPTCPLDSLLLDFAHKRRQRIHSGATLPSAAGPPEVLFSATHDFTSLQSDQPITSMLIDVLSKFPDVARLPERIAVLYVMFVVSRWQICGDRESWDALPEWARCVEEQVGRKHAAFVDYLPWPHMRRHLSHPTSPVDFTDFFVPYTCTLSLNWPHGDETVLTRTPGRPRASRRMSGENARRSTSSSSPTGRPADQAGDGAGGLEEGEATLSINPAFMEHLRDLRNWSLGSRFRNTFPFLCDGSVRIEDH
ncbi:unnamed protein product [Zymoseptoria tritici ST99CH_1E4]|uniref:BZIP domain-containing protein n=1 Tax=Zymoseptoria tritici ST99CH_1E4 TaxID=1276532 RepID=A0A2H1G513_ZYMTR|nr:unnamed protein product [Zymoseptoria tritici ST99CH_1E4]